MILLGSPPVNILIQLVIAFVAFLARGSPLTTKSVPRCQGTRHEL